MSRKRVISLPRFCASWRTTTTQASIICSVAPTIPHHRRNNMEYAKRKHPRLKSYDYSETGVYFLTVCTKNKVHLMGKIVGRDDPGAPCPPLPQLSAIGQYVQRLILNIETSYPFIKLLNHVVMPNHIHLLLEICSSESGAPGSSRPTQTMFEKPCCVPRSTTVIPRVITTHKKFSNADDEYY